MLGLETRNEFNKAYSSSKGIDCYHSRVARMLESDVNIKEVDANLDNRHEEYLERESTFQRYQPMHLSSSRNWILD